MVVAGSPPQYVPGGNTCSFVFSNPFEQGSKVLQHATPGAAQSHHIPNIPQDKPIFVSATSGEQLTWSQLRSQALRIAAGLLSIGLRPAELVSSSLQNNVPPTISPLVMLHLPNCIEFAPLLLGVFAAGLTATTVSTALSSEELSKVVNDAEPQLIVTNTATWETMLNALSKQTKPALQRLLNDRRVYIVEPVLVPHTLISSGRKLLQSWKSLLFENPLSEPAVYNDAESKSRAAIVLWSSGTSGTPKGVVISHQALNASLAAVWHANPRYNDQERWIGFVPFYHTFGLTNILLIGPCCGATVFVMPKYEPKAFLSGVQQHQITTLHMAPPVAVMLAKSPLVEGIKFSSVRSALSGGAPLSSDVVQQVYNRTGVEVKMGYGLSEACSVCNQDDSINGDLTSSRGNTGRPMYGVELAIVGSDSTELPVEQEGEILIRSPSIMNGYLRNESATRECLDDNGWFHTGDLGKIDNLGRLWITGRLKEIIKVKGFQVSPAELEGVLHKSASILDVAVSSIFDPNEQSEQPRAFVVPAKTELQNGLRNETASTNDFTEIAAHIRQLTEQRLARYKWLTGNVVFVTEIPKSPAGKVLRRLLASTKGVEFPMYTRRRNESKL